MAWSVTFKPEAWNGSTVPATPVQDRAGHPPFDVRHPLSRGWQIDAGSLMVRRCARCQPAPWRKPGCHLGRLGLQWVAPAAGHDAIPGASQAGTWCASWPVVTQRCDATVPGPRTCQPPARAKESAAGAADQASTAPTRTHGTVRARATRVRTSQPQPSLNPRPLGPSAPRRPDRRPCVCVAVALR